ncbi:MAG: hypothetical protein JNM25_16320 [Planctomycetes bacterium]|nr:hypothetical protein [Planctomycetota bacterium]
MTRATVRGLGLVVFALAWLAYGVALGGDYVFDDVHSVAANTALHDLGDLGRLLVDPSAFSATGQRMYRPALLVSFALNLAVSPAAWSLKAGNVLLHAAAAWLLWRWQRSWRVPVPAAFVAAALFAVHPLLSEAINLVSARSELLLGCGVLLTLLAHRRWQRARRPGLAMVGMVFGTMVACGSKETGVVLPALLAAQVLAARARDGARLDWRRAVAGVLPVVMLVLAYLVLRRVLLGQATVDLLARGGGDPTTGHGRTLLVQLATMGTLLPQALWQMVVPVGMTLDPPVTFRASPCDPMVLLGWGSLFALSAAAAWPGRTAGPRRVGLAVAWLLALPWIVVPLNMPLAEHRLYGPMLGIALVVAVSLPRLRGARAVAIAGALLLLGLTGAVRRTLDYRDEVSLWQAELAGRPESFQAHWGLGATWLRRGDPAAALAPLAQAHALRPQHHDALSYYAEALVSLPDAAAQPSRALEVTALLAAQTPDDPWVRTLAAQAHLQAGRATGDREHFEAAERLALSCLQIAEPKGYVFQLAAAARRGLGDLQGALAHLDASIARGLHHTSVRLDRAAVLRDLGRYADARRELQTAQREAPMEPAVLRALQDLAQPPR